MRTLVFDGRTGAAGDMICAALIAAGADPAALRPVERRLPVRYAVDEAVKNGIRSTTVDVLVDDGTPAEEGTAEADRDGRHDHGDRNGLDHGDHDHHHGGHDHDHGDHDHDHDHDDHRHAEGSGVHRSYGEVISLVESMEIPEAVESTACEAFELLGRAEASVHGTALSETHFHEVGADDAIADVVGAALLLADLDVDRVVTTPIAAGGGSVAMSHGTYPVPTPAVVEIAERSGLRLRGGPIERELLTPTGAAILGAVAGSVDAIPTLQVSSVGYGAGDATFDSHPNVLRTLLGDGGNEASATDANTGGLRDDDVVVLETNVDDASPEVLGGLQETLSRAGARDVTIVPTTMKKSRPGHLITVICKPADAEAVAERLARETGTLGVRQTGATHRWIADRSIETAVVEADGTEHEVAVKIATTSDGTVYDVSAEYDDAAAVAERTGTPIRDVLRTAEAAVRARHDGSGDDTDGGGSSDYTDGDGQ